MTNPPMNPSTLRDVILGTLEDFNVDEMLPADRLSGPGGLVDSLVESWLKDRNRAVERIARAIEVANGDRCPECDGKPASNKWSRGRGPLVKIGRCGAGHTWEIRSNHWVDPARVARDQGATASGS